MPDMPDLYGPGTGLIRPPSSTATPNPSNRDDAKGFGQWLNKISGNAANNDFNKSEAEIARQFSSAESQKARDFELYMSNTAYQRAVSDMKKAGLNPAMLAGLVGSGSPASTGSGNAASGIAATASSSRHSSNVIGTLLRTVVSLAILAK